jgi:tetratricopeptide (TPR) repeat protein
MTRAQAFLQDEDFSGAIADLDELVKHTIYMYEALVLRGETYLRIGNVERAIADSSEAIRTMPERYSVGPETPEFLDFDILLTRAHYCRGQASEQKEEWDRAIADYTEAIRTDPNSAPGYNSRGRLYLYEKREYEKAVADFTNVVRISPDCAIAYINRGLAHSLNGEGEEALGDFEKAIQHDPNHAFAYVNRGIAYAQKGRIDKAMADLDEAIKLDPSFALAYEVRGNLYREKGEAAKAEVDLAKAKLLSEGSD